MSLSSAFNIINTFPATPQFTYAQQVQESLVVLFAGELYRGRQVAASRRGLAQRDSGADGREAADRASGQSITRCHPRQDAARHRHSPRPLGGDLISEKVRRQL